MTTRGPIGPTIGKAWTNNARLYAAAPAAYFMAIGEYLARETPEFFRWHIGGDAPSAEYIRQMIALAEAHNHTQFAAYTQRHRALPAPEYIPANLHLRASLWPNQPRASAGDHARAYVQQPGTALEPDSFECPGACSTCKHCYTTNTDVTFRKH